MKRLLTGVAVAIGCVAGAHAQPAEGEIVFSTTAGVFHLPADFSSAESVWPGTGVGSIRLQCIKTASGNQSVVGGSATGAMFQLTVAGTVFSLTSLTSGWATGIDLDTEHRYICSASTAGLVTKGISGGSSVFHNASGATVNGICRNLRTGDWAFVTTAPAPEVLAVVPFNGQSMTRLSLIPSGATGICYMPDIDQYAVTFLSTTTPLQIYSSSGTLQRSVVLPTNVRGNCCAYDQRTSRLYVGTAEGVLYELTNTGAFVRRRSTTRGSISGIDVFGDQRISVRVVATGPSSVNVILYFAGSAGKPYCLALSLGVAPGLTIPGAGRINLAPDGLFFATVCGGQPFFTQAFTGTMRPTNSANGYFTIPAHVPVGTPIHVSGVVIDPAQPGGFLVGNTETVVQH